MSSNVGIVLTGGGARGAYQAGVLSCLSEVAESCNIKIQIFSGISAGSINATFCGLHSNDLLLGARSLAHLWGELHSYQVYKTGVTSLSSIGAKWISDVAFGGFYKKKLAQSLVDTEPLRKLLADFIDFKKLPQRVAEGHLKALACSAFNYSENQTVIFTQGKSLKTWESYRRRSEVVEMGVNHIMASSAIPILFPSVEIDGLFYGDGSLRNTTPIGPIINLGADKIFIIGVRNPMSQSHAQTPQKGSPSVGRIFGLMLNSLFFDTIDIDVERIRHLNDIISACSEHGTNPLPFKKVDYMWLRPSLDLAGLAKDFSYALPSSIRYLLNGLGDPNEASDLASYLMFEGPYSKKLIDLGYQETLLKKDEIVSFLKS